LLAKKAFSIPKIGSSALVIGEINQLADAHCNLLIEAIIHTD
jgi:hypothetical protein